MLNKIIHQLYRIIFLLVRRWFPPNPEKLKGRKFSRILVFSAAGIGDTLTDSVAIRAIKESFPDAQVLVVTHRRRCSIAEHNPYVDKVVRYHKSLLAFLPRVFELRRFRPEVIVMLRGNDPDLWPMAYLVNRHAIVSSPVMTSFAFLISHPVNLPQWDTTHGVEQTLQIVETIGAGVADKRLVYQVRDDEKSEMKSIIRRWNPDDLPIVVFQLGGGARSTWRDWPVEYFGQLGRRLLDEFRIKLVLLGGRDQLAKAQELRPLLPPEVVDLTGQLSLTQSAALLSKAAILVSTDTGIMHLGFAVNVDTLALIHCNNPASRVGPYGYGDKNPVVQLEPPEGVVPSKSVSMTLLKPKLVWPAMQSLCERHGFSRNLTPTGSIVVVKTGWMET
jgi:ADP-heptose:LPS heptosyltransferase